MPPPTVVRFTFKRRLLPWNRRYVLKSYISGSMWLVPLFALLVYAAFHRVVHAIGAWMVERGWTNDATSFQAGCRYAETKVVPGGRKSVTTTSGAA